jgi:iron complex outermembrane receptor protein
MVNKIFLKKRTLTLCVLTLSSLKAMAEDDSYLSMDIEQLLQVPVTGSTLHDESIITVPAAVSIFTHDQIENLGIDYLYELLNLSPGFQFDRGADSGVNYTFSSRGRRNSSQAREVLVVIDGVNMTNPRTGSADVTLPLIPLDQIERVEIIRGPGSAIYGSSAFSGVINIVTRKGKNSVKLDVGTDNRRSISVMLAKPLGEWTTNFYGRAYADTGQGYWVQDTFTKAPLYTTDPRKTFDVDFSVAKGETKIRIGYHRLSTDDFFVIENTLNNFVDTSASLKQFSVEQGLHIWNGVNSKVQFNYLKVDQHSSVPVIGAGVLAARSTPSSNEPLLTKGFLAGDGYNINFTNNWNVSESATGLIGMELKQESENEAYVKNNYDLGQLMQNQVPINYYGNFSHSTPLGSEDTYRSVGIYGQYQHDLSEATNLTAGLRYDEHNNFGSRSSPRLGLVHLLSSTQTVKLLYGEAFRAPSLAEMGIINNPLFVGNPNLDYEGVKTLDLLWIGTWENVIVSAGAFKNDYTDAIVAGFTGTSRTFVNGGDESSDGYMLGAKYFLTPDWTLRTVYTKFTSLPDSAFREAEELGSMELNYNHAKWNWNLMTYYQSERYTLTANNGLKRLDDFWVVNSKLRYSFQNDYKISLQLKNLTNLVYTTPAQGTSIPEGVPNRGREISMALEWAF